MVTKLSLHDCIENARHILDSQQDFTYHHLIDALDEFQSAGIDAEREHDALRAEVARWKAGNDAERARGDRAVARAVSAEAEVERLQAALERHHDPQLSRNVYPPLTHCGTCLEPLASDMPRYD